MLYASILLLSYLIGCIPSGYLIVKISSGKNIFFEGTGNNGAANSVDITNSKITGAIVLFLDLLKALIPTLIFFSFGFQNIEIISFALAILLGHNFNVFFRFRGGRGLSSAAGIFLIFAPALVAIWLASYFAINAKVKNIITSSAVSIIIITVLGLTIESLSVNFFGISLSSFDRSVLIAGIALITLSKHIPKRLN